MAKYFNPADELPKVGRRLQTSSDYQTLQAQLKPDEVLVGMYDRGLFMNCPLLKNETDFKYFENQLNQGFLLSHEFYAVSLEKAKDHIPNLCEK